MAPRVWTTKSLNKPRSSSVVPAALAAFPVFGDALRRVVIRGLEGGDPEKNPFSYSSSSLLIESLVVDGAGAGARTLSALGRDFVACWPERDRFATYHEPSTTFTMNALEYAARRLCHLTNLEDLVVVRIDAAIPVLAALPWETLWLPRADEPLLFSTAVKKGVEIVREHPEGMAAGAGGRRVENKCLAAFAPRGELLVDKEVDELRLRLLRHPALRFRWVIDPDVDELLARLQLECTLFLFAGHGRLAGDRYEVELKSASVEAAALQPALIRSRAEVLLFDSCESADGDALRGLPALLSALPSATCLLGMAGPTDDTLSSWHMPGLVERLFLGEPVWSCLHLLRRMLWESRSGFWVAPVLHLKRSYQPFAPSPGTTSYLDALAAQVARRKRPSSG